MRKSTHEIEPFRLKEGPLASDEGFGMNGVFYIPLLRMPLTTAICIVSDGSTEPGKLAKLVGKEIGNNGWEHVSVRISVKRSKHVYSRIPEWAEMCVIKDIFWEAGEDVMQLHPNALNYVNKHSHVLHLWRPTKANIPMPPIELV